MLTLNDFLHLTDVQLKNTKVRLLVTNTVGINPLDLYKENPDNCFNSTYWNNCTYKPGQYVIGLINMGNDRWLLCTIGKILSVDKTIQKHAGIACEYETLTQYESFFGRLIIRFHNNCQQVFRDGDKIMDKLEIDQLLPACYTGFDFPGYDNVCLSYKELKTIVDGFYPSYKNALQNQKAVYLITDKETGKLYVGSATSDKGLLLDRWSSYVKNGHGGNVELIEIVREKGFDYVKENFQYTIIEHFDRKDDAYILGRETYWKNVFQSRKHGYNKN